MQISAISSFTIAAIMLFATVSFASAATGTIVSPHQYSWNDNGGYVNWNATSSNVTVTDTELSGYIWSAGFGWINLAPTNGGVTNSNGTLSGSAWSQNAGYIDFTGVTIDSSGEFHGHTVAQPTFGTMTFDCDHCDVNTSWRAPASNSGGGAPASKAASSNGQIVGSAMSAPSTNNASSTASTISLLQAQLLSLTAQLATLTASKGSTASTYTFTRNLQLNSVSPDVKALQMYLNSHGFPVATSGIGSSGHESTRFGPATYRALKRFQAANGLLSTGYFGPLTRAFVSSQ